MVADCDVLPRQGFTQVARNMRCQLYFPYATEQVVLLRTGVLVHINAYMHALGLTPDSAPPQQNGVPSSHTDAPTDTDPADQAPPKAQQAHGITANPRGSDLMHGSDGATADDLDLDSSAVAEGDDMNEGIRHSEDAQLSKDPHEQDASVPHSLSEAATASAAAVLDWHGPIRPEKREELRKVWERLKETVEALPHVACYTVASVAFRR